MYSPVVFFSSLPSFFSASPPPPALQLISRRATLSRTHSTAPQPYQPYQQVRRQVVNPPPPPPPPSVKASPSSPSPAPVPVAVAVPAPAPPPSVKVGDHLLTLTSSSLKLQHLHSNKVPASTLPLHYLRRLCSSNFNLSTGQRTDVQIEQSTGKRLDVVVSSSVGASSSSSTPPQPASSAIGLSLDNASGGSSSSSSSSDVLVKIDWSDGRSSVFDVDWLLSKVLNPSSSSTHISKRPVSRRESYPPKVQWGSKQHGQAVGPGTFDLHVDASVPFSDVVSSSSLSGVHSSLSKLYKYGILLVTDVPSQKSHIAAFAAALSGGSQKRYATQSLLPTYWSSSPSSRGTVNLFSLDDSVTDGPLPNLYGKLWSTVTSDSAPGASVADSAYTSDALPVHTDMTYYAHPPGLQVFSMLSPSLVGGESLFVDGLSVAERLRETDLQAFNTMCEVEHTYRCTDDASGWHLEARGPVIKAERGNGLPGHPYERFGKVLQIRHNDLDRLPTLPPNDILSKPDNDKDVQRFYERVDRALNKWNELLHSDEFRYVIPLKAGEMVAVANQRVLHGRQCFTMARSVQGTYVGQDDLDSRFRRFFDYGE